MNRIKLTPTEKQATLYSPDGIPVWIKPLRELDASDNITSARIFDEGRYKDWDISEVLQAIEIDGYTGIITLHYLSGWYLEVQSINKPNPAAILMKAAEMLKEYEQANGV